MKAGVEVVARAMAESDRSYWDRTIGGTTPPWADLSERARDEYRRLALVALEAVS